MIDNSLYKKTYSTCCRICFCVDFAMGRHLHHLQVLEDNYVPLSHSVTSVIPQQTSPQLSNFPLSFLVRLTLYKDDNYLTQSHYILMTTLWSLRPTISPHIH